jgi:hypothetical protein
LIVIREPLAVAATVYSRHGVPSARYQVRVIVRVPLYPLRELAHGAADPVVSVSSSHPIASPLGSATRGAASARTGQAGPAASKNPAQSAAICACAMAGRVVKIPVLIAGTLFLFTLIGFHWPWSWPRSMRMGP